MTKTFKRVAFTALIAGVICGLAYWYLTYAPPDDRPDVRQVDGGVASMGMRTEEHTTEIQEHRQQVIEKTVVIREKVRSEIDILDADSLALAALREIELWRGSSGDNTPAHPPRMDK